MQTYEHWHGKRGDSTKWSWGNGRRGGDWPSQEPRSRLPKTAPRSEPAPFSCLPTTTACVYLCLSPSLACSFVFAPGSSFLAWSGQGTQVFSFKLWASDRSPLSQQPPSPALAVRPNATYSVPNFFRFHTCLNWRAKFHSLSLSSEFHICHIFLLAITDQRLVASARLYHQSQSRRNFCFCMLVV